MVQYHIYLCKCVPRFIYVIPNLSWSQTSLSRTQMKAWWEIYTHITGYQYLGDSLHMLRVCTWINLLFTRRHRLHQHFTRRFNPPATRQTWTDTWRHTTAAMCWPRDTNEETKAQLEIRRPLVGHQAVEDMVQASKSNLTSFNVFQYCKFITL